MDGSFASIIAAFTLLTVALSGSFLRLATSLAKLQGSVDELVTSVRGMRETAEKNTRSILRLSKRLAIIEGRFGPDNGPKQ